MRPLSSSWSYPVARAGGLHFTVERVEGLKWLAVLAMLIDHVNSYLLAGQWPVMFVIGRAAFPLFALALALALQGDPDRARRCAFRLLPFALAAQVGSQLVRDEVVLNILFLFIAAAAWIAADEESRRERIVVRCLAGAVAALSEFGLPGFLLVLLTFRAAPQFSFWRFVAVVMAFGLVTVTDGNVSGWPVTAVLMLLAVLLPVEIPRVRNAFAAVYVLQFPAFLLLRWFHG